MADKKGLLGQYQKNTPPPSGGDMQNIPKLIEHYNAIEQGKAQRFKIYDAKNNFDLYQYSHLIEVSFRDGNLTITTTTRIFILTGKNLHRIAELLGDGQVKAIREFNPNRHTAPKEENAVLIESIERTE